MVRNDVVRLPANGGARGSVQRGSRFGVVVQSDELVALSTVIVAPTSQSAPNRPFRPEIRVHGGLTRVIIEQMRAMDRRRVGEVVGHLGHDEALAMDRALLVVLDLPR